ncbi:MAG: hypothetical protein JWO37_1786 [Acidimicrobiales bacterium]|nr:hypothetical protein [Acidimicrobiales bacterium]
MVTVSATYGAGGTLIAPLLATRLGLPFADRLGGSKPMASSAGDVLSEAERAEEPRNTVLDGLALLSAGWNIPVPRDPELLPEHVRNHLEASIGALIANGGAVILGRAAAIALGRRPGAFHVRLDGPVERRARRGAAWEGVDLDTARAHLTDTDTVRSRSVRKLYHQDPADPSLYHLVVDTSVLTLDACVDLLANAAQAFWAHDDDDDLERDIAAARDRLPR